MLSFRRAGSGRSLWIEAPVRAPSRADVFARADRLSDDALVSALSRRLR